MPNLALDRLRKQVERDTTAKMVVHALDAGAAVTPLAASMEVSRQHVYNLHGEGLVLLGREESTQ